MGFATSVIALTVGTTVVQGFAPSSSPPGSGKVSSSSTQIQGSLFDAVSNMDLFAPKKDQNTYGARKKKNLSLGEIQEGKSYVPSGLTASQYSNIRKDQVKRRAENYQRNVAKAGVFEDYTEFYLKRGTDTSQDWKTKNKNTLGHRMAKTKYDWAGTPGANFGGTTAKVKKDAAGKKKGSKISGWSFGKKK